MTKITAVLASFMVLAGLGLAAYYIILAPSRSTCSQSPVAGGVAAIGGPFELVDHNGSTVTDQDVIEGLTLVYFGYTTCPDVCPIDTVRNLETVDILKAQKLDVKPVFITIDPERDTPEILADYVDNLDSGMVGLTGSLAQVTAASKAYKTYFAKAGEGEDYLMDHSTFTYLMHPQKGFLEYFHRESTPENMAKTITCFAALD